jgi:hypothetical protein
MRIEVQSKHRTRARRLFVPVGEFSFAAFPVGPSRIIPRGAGPVALQATSSRRSGTTLTKPWALARLTEFEVETNSNYTAVADAAPQVTPTCFVCKK